MTNTVKVGIITLVAIILFAWVVVALKRWTAAGARYEIHIIFDKIAGLTQRDAVKIAGFKIGDVSRIHQLPDIRCKLH